MCLRLRRIGIKNVWVKPNKLLLASDNIPRGIATTVRVFNTYLAGADYEREAASGSLCRHTPLWRRTDLGP